MFTLRACTYPLRHIFRDIVRCVSLHFSPQHHFTLIDLETLSLIWKTFHPSQTSVKMSIVKQEDLDEQRGVKREHELDSNLTDELVHCIDKARLAQRYLGLGGSACTDILGIRLTPTKGEQDVVFVSFQCESMGRIEKPQAGERARIHNIEISFVGSAIHSNNSHKNEKWSWAKNVTSKRPTQKSRFRRSQAIENSKFIERTPQLYGEH